MVNKWIIDYCDDMNTFMINYDDFANMFRLELSVYALRLFNAFDWVWLLYYLNRCRFYRSNLEKFQTCSGKIDLREFFIAMFSSLLYGSQIYFEYAFTVGSFCNLDFSITRYDFLIFFDTLAYVSAPRATQAKRVAELHQAGALSAGNVARDLCLFFLGL